MLLCEYVPDFPEAINKVSSIKGSWLVFLLFYMGGVSIVFELVKAFTIEARPLAAHAADWACGVQCQPGLASRFS